MERMAKRNFRHVLREIELLLTPELKADFTSVSTSWDRNDWDALNTWINTHVTPSSKDQTSVKLYATLCGCTEEQMRRALVADGV